MSGIDTDKVSRWWQLVTLQKIISIYIFFFVFSFFEREKTSDVDSIWLHPCAYPCVFAADYSKWCVSLVPLRDTSVLCALPGSGSLPLPTAQVTTVAVLCTAALCAGRKMLSRISADHCYRGGSELPGEQLHLLSCPSADMSESKLDLPFQVC